MATIISNSPEDTLVIGEIWASEMQTGWVIGLDGNLGSGKTQLVKGVARGLDIVKPVISPTFTLVREYEGTTKLSHMDFYRLQNDDQIIAAGLESYLSPVGITVIEWFSRWTGPRPEKFRHAIMTQTGENERRIEYEDSCT